MTTVTTSNTPNDTSNLRSSRTARTLVGCSVAAVTAFVPVAGVVDAAPSAFVQQEDDDTAAAAPIGLGDRNESAAWWQDRMNEWLRWMARRQVGRRHVGVIDRDRAATASLDANPAALNFRRADHNIEGIAGR